MVDIVNINVRKCITFFRQLISSSHTRNNRWKKPAQIIKFQSSFFVCAKNLCFEFQTYTNKIVFQYLRIEIHNNLVKPSPQPLC